MSALQRLLAGKPGGAFNLGTGHGYSVRQVLDAISAETGVPLEAVPGARRQGDPPVLVADASLAKAELGFKPSRSDLKNIVKTAWAWHRHAHPERQPSAVTCETLPTAP